MGKEQERIVYPERKYLYTQADVKLNYDEVAFSPLREAEVKQLNGAAP